MKKKMIAVIVIVANFISSNIMPALATEVSYSSKSDLVQSYDKGNISSITMDNNQTINVKKILKLNDAITGAINNSDNLALKSKEITMYEDKMKLQEKTNDFYESISQKVYAFPYDKLELQKKHTEQSKDFIEDQITSDITNKYNDMVLMEIEINKDKRNLELKNYNLNFLNGKLSLGMSTPTEITDAQIEIKSLQDEIMAKENLLNDKKDYFKVLTNLDLKNTYKLNYDINYTKYKIDGSVDDYINEKLNNYFKYDDKILNLTKDYMKDLKDDGIKDIMNQDAPAIPKSSDYMTTDTNGNATLDSGKYALNLIDYEQKELKYYVALQSYSSYIDGKFSYDESKVKLADSKKNLKNVLKENYSTLLDLENKIDILKEQVISTNTKLSFAKAQVDMGLMLKNDYDMQVLSSQDLDTSLRKLIYTHDNLRDSIQKPWILTNQ